MHELDNDNEAFEQLVHVLEISDEEEAQAIANKLILGVIDIASR